MSEDTQDDANKAKKAPDAIDAAAVGATDSGDGEQKARYTPGERGGRGERGERGPRGGRDRREREGEDNVFEKVVFINRCSKVVKGGRRFSFSALVVTGDQQGKVGFGFGKALEVSDCIKKASDSSRNAMEPVNIGSNTIPHPVVGRHGGGVVKLFPASPGTGLIAGGGVRAVVEAAGVKDILAKSMGSNNHANVVKATLDALSQLRGKEEIYKLRGKRLEAKRAL